MKGTFDEVIDVADYESEVEITRQKTNGGPVYQKTTVSIETVKEAAVKEETLNIPFILCGVAVRINRIKDVFPKCYYAFVHRQYINILKHGEVEVYQTSLTLFTTLMQANYTIFPDGDGVPHLIKLDDMPLTPDEINILEADIKSISFTLYTRRQPQGQVITIDDPNSVSRSDWNPDRSTALSTHGWKSAGNTESCTTVRDAYLKIFDCNIIVIDWSKIAQNTYYPTVAKSVPRVAEHIASFVNFMRLKAKLDTKQLKMVGHSLGAHVSSLAARIVKQSSLVAEVIALDPAKPMFEDNGPDGRVDRSHADHVQVVHTNAGLLGMSKAVGTSDFYGNGGSTQPGCGFDLFGICAHSRSYFYYGESIGNSKGFPGKPKSGGVGEAHMGGPVLDAKARGYSFDFPTRDKTPFASVPVAA